MDDKQFIAGFGSNGGEEFLSYMNIGESLVVKGDDAWKSWDKSISENLNRVQNSDGSWSGHDCITGRTFCTVGGAAGADGGPLAAADLGEDEAAVNAEVQMIAHFAGGLAGHVAAALVIFLFACAAGAETPGGGASARRVDAALEKAARYLVAKQSPDGAWRSETYGAMRDGPSLTPLVMSALLFLPQAGADGQAALGKGADYLAGFAGDDGRLKVQARELLFPVYTAASASRVLALVERSPRNVRAQQAWLAYLRGRQLNESLGWQPADPEYGGWGYALDVPRKPAPGKPKELLDESNLAATVFAWRHCGRRRCRPAIRLTPRRWVREALPELQRRSRQPPIRSSTTAVSSSSPAMRRRTRRERRAAIASATRGSTPTAR